MTAAPQRVHMTLRLPDRTGAAKMAAGFGRALRAEGFDLTLIHGTTPVDGPTILPDFQAMGARTVLEPRLERPYDPRLVRSLAIRVRREGGVCVIGVNQRDRVPALLAAHRAGVPGILMVQNQHHFWGPRPVAALKARGYASVVAARTTLAVCTSTVVRDEMVRFGVPVDSMVVLPNGIDTAARPALDVDERASLRAEMGASGNELLLLEVGRLDPQKGQDVLLAAIGRGDLPAPVHLTLVGSAGDSVAGRKTADYERSLHAQVAELGLRDRVTFLGWRDDVDRLLAAADGYVHAARWEGPALPLAVMEAMAAGCPVVLTDCSGVPPGFVDGRHGLLATTGDAGSLHERISQLAAMTAADRVTMGAEGAALIEARYRIEDLGRAFTRLVGDVISRDRDG